MIWPMANSQILTSKKPRSGARTFMPLAIKMIRIVLRVTTHSSATKTSRGRVEILGTMEPLSQLTVELLSQVPSRPSGKPTGNFKPTGGRNTGTLKGSFHTSDGEATQDQNRCQCPS